MEIVIDLVVVLHFIGLASLLGGFLVQMKAPGKVVNPAMLHGALTQLVTGLVLVGLHEAMDHDVDHVKIGIKLVLALVITALVLVGRRRESVGTGLWGAIGGLTLLEIVVAVLV